MKNQRNARTRTLIQLGGLVEKVGLAQRFGIELGCDLQLDTGEKEKALLLIGFLHQALDGLENNTTCQLKEFRKMGLQILHRS